MGKIPWRNILELQKKNKKKKKKETISRDHVSIMRKDKNKLKIKLGGGGGWEREILAVKVGYTASNVVYKNLIFSTSMINKF